MSGCMTAKRLLEVDEDEDSQGENHRLNLKRYQHDVYSRSVSASRSSSPGPHGRALSLKTLSYKVQKLFVGFEEGVAGAPLANCKLPISLYIATD
jgi:hypothetical protein